MRRQHYPNRPVTLDFRVTDKELLLFVNILTIQKHQQLPLQNLKNIRLQNAKVFLSLYALLMPAVRLWLANENGWLGINLKIRPCCPH